VLDVVPGGSGAASPVGDFREASEERSSSTIFGSPTRFLRQLSKIYTGHFNTALKRRNRLKRAYLFALTFISGSALESGSTWRGGKLLQSCEEMEER